MRFSHELVLDTGPYLPYQIRGGGWLSFRPAPSPPSGSLSQALAAPPVGVPRPRRPRRPIGLRPQRRHDEARRLPPTCGAPVILRECGHYFFYDAPE